MKLESIGFGAHAVVEAHRFEISPRYQIVEGKRQSGMEAAWEELPDNIQLDAIQERIQLSDAGYLDLQGITGLQRMLLLCRPVKKQGFFKTKYDSLQPLHVIAIRKEKNQRKTWTFLCSSKELFLTLAKEFQRSYTLEAELRKDDMPGCWDETESVETKTIWGEEGPNAKNFLKQVDSSVGSPAYDAHCAFLSYLLKEGEKARRDSAGNAFYWGSERNKQNCTYCITGCRFHMPKDKRDFHPAIERCLICEGWDFGRVSDVISAFLPQNTKMRAAWELRQLRNERGGELARKAEILEEYRQSVSVGNVLPRMQSVQQEIDSWRKRVEADKSGFVEAYLAMLQEKREILKQEIARELEQYEFDPKSAGESKEKLLGFLENLRRGTCGAGERRYLEYLAAERRIQEIGRSLAGSVDEDWGLPAYDAFYRLGRILIGSCLNRSQANGRKRPVSQMELDDAMMYFYETATAEEAYRRQKRWEEGLKGEAGEREVDHVLAFLAAKGDYKAVPKKWSKEKRRDVIRLYNPKFIDKRLEYDHIVVGKQGVFVIETKNFNGKIIITPDEMWIREAEDGSRVGEKNPVQQVDWHIRQLKSFLKEIPVIGIICIAHRKAILEGRENSPIPVVKSDALDRMIEGYPVGDRELSKEEIEACLSLIEHYRYQEEA